ncbi:MAG: hypothetical protein WCB36_01555 [Burkholderiales bacterium]
MKRALRYRLLLDRNLSRAQYVDFDEAVTAVVVKKKEAVGLNEAGIIQALKKEIANYKVPKNILFIEDLPRSAMGKVQKNILRETYGKRQ